MYQDPEESSVSWILWNDITWSYYVQRMYLPQRNYHFLLSMSILLCLIGVDISLWNRQLIGGSILSIKLDWRFNNLIFLKHSISLWEPFPKCNKTIFIIKLHTQFSIEVSTKKNNPMISSTVADGYTWGFDKRFLLFWGLSRWALIVRA